MATLEGLEPPAYWFEANRSIHLSYGVVLPILSLRLRRLAPSLDLTIWLVALPSLAMNFRECVRFLLSSYYLRTPVRWASYPADREILHDGQKSKSWTRKFWFTHKGGDCEA